MDPNKKKHQIYNNLHLFLKPKIDRSFNLIYSDLTEELLQTPFGNKVVLSKNLPIKKIIQLMNGKNSINKIANKTLTSDRDLLEITYLLEKKGFLSNKKKIRLKLPNIRNSNINIAKVKPAVTCFLGKNISNKITGDYLIARGSLKEIIYIDNSLSRKEIKTRIIKSNLVIGAFQSDSLNLFVNRICLANNIKWIPFNLNFENSLIDIGPFIHKNGTNCYLCYSKRSKEGGLFTKNDYIFKQKDIVYQKIIRKINIFLAEYLANLIPLFLSKDIFKKDKILSINLEDGKVTQNFVLKDVRCKFCNNINRIDKIDLKFKEVVYFENGLRIISAQETWKKAKKLISHTGIISKVILFKNIIDNQYNYKAISADPLGNNRFRSHAGKGITMIQNRNSAVMEAIERYCAKYAMLDPFKKQVIGSYNGLKAMAIHPSKFQIPISNFKDDKKISWVKAWSLTNNRPCLLPYEFVSLIPIGSNGLASGNCIEEAILHGIFELVERDIYMIMDLNEIVMPDVDLSGLKNEEIKKLLTDLNNSNNDYRIKYILNTNNIPTFGMFIRGRVGERTGYSYAVCSHLHKEIALSRTITEAIQIYPKFPSEGRWLNKNTDHYAEPSKKRVYFSEIVDYHNSDIKTNIDHCVSTFKKQGMEAFVVDHSLPNIGFSVVRVLITGLQPIWFKKNSCVVDRVFTVPRTLGFKQKKLKDLNYGNFAGFPYYVK